MAKYRFLSPLKGTLVKNLAYLESSSRLRSALVGVDDLRVVLLPGRAVLQVKKIALKGAL